MYPHLLSNKSKSGMFEGQTLTQSCWEDFNLLLQSSLVLDSFSGTVSIPPFFFRCCVLVTAALVDRTIVAFASFGRPHKGTRPAQDSFHLRGIRLTKITGISSLDASEFFFKIGR